MERIRVASRFGAGLLVVGAFGALVAVAARVKKLLAEAAETYGRAALVTAWRRGEALHAMCQTEGRYIRVFLRFRLDELQDKDLEALYGNRREEYECDPPAVGDAHWEPLGR
jgi:hypothetical protein